jgi:hypothetical protein
VCSGVGLAGRGGMRRRLEKGFQDSIISGVRLPGKMK